MDNYDNLRKAAAQHSTTPRPLAWNRLEQKLDADLVSIKRKKTKLKYRLMAAAACALLISVFSVIVQESNKSTPLLAHGQIAAWEELASSEDSGLYDLDNLRRLNLAFQTTDYLNGLLGNQSSSGTNFLRMEGTH
jgi:hypothetical protein